MEPSLPGLPKWSNDAKRPGSPETHLSRLLKPMERECGKAFGSWGHGKSEAFLCFGLSKGETLFGWAMLGPFRTEESRAPFFFAGYFENPRHSAVVTPVGTLVAP